MRCFILRRINCFAAIPPRQELEDDEADPASAVVRGR
jgi:hypothetical protein